MTPEELRQDIAELRSKREAAGIDVSKILLVVPRERPPAGRTVGFARRYGPRGEIANVQEDDSGGYEVAAYFDCQKILDWMDKENI